MQLGAQLERASQAFTAKSERHSEGKIVPCNSLELMLQKAVFVKGKIKGQERALGLKKYSIIALHAHVSN